MVVLRVSITLLQVQTDGNKEAEPCKELLTLWQANGDRIIKLVERIRAKRSMHHLTPDRVKDLLPILRLEIIPRKFILVNGRVATITACQKIWHITDKLVADTYPGLRLNWTQNDDGTQTAGYVDEAKYTEIANKLCKWLEEVGAKEPTPEVTVGVGWKLYFNGSPVGPKLDFEQTKGSKCSFPAELYNSMCFLDKAECFETLKRQINYMLDQLRLKGHYASLREDVANILKERKYI